MIDIKRNLYLSEKRTIQPIDINEASVDAKLVFIPQDFETSEYITAINAYAMPKDGGEVRTASASYTGDAITLYVGEGLFVPGKNLLQLEIVQNIGTVVTFTIPVNCEAFLPNIEEPPVIVQGSNNPLYIELDTDIAQATDISVSLVHGDRLVKTWGRSDVTTQGKVISVAVTQAETMEFPVGAARILVKALLDGETVFYGKMGIDIVAWEDRSILGG